MPRSLLVEALGHTIGVELDVTLDPAERAALTALWADAPGRGAPEAWLRVGRPVSRGPQPDVVALDLPRLAADLSTRMTLAALDLARDELLLLHAAAVARPDGGVIAFVGPSGGGKTTVAAELARELGYLSDETVGIAADGTVLPYRKPLSLVTPGGVKRQASPRALGLAPLPDAPLRIVGVLLLDRDPTGPRQPLLEELPLALAIPAIVPQTSHLARLDLPLQRLARLADRVGGLRRLRYREAASLAPLVTALEASGRGQPAWQPETPDGLAPAAGPTSYRRAPVSDAITTPEGLLVMRGDVVRLVDGIGPALWRAARTSASRDELVSAALDANGAPADGDADRLVDRALESLCAAGLLIRGRGWRRGDVAEVRSEGRVALLRLDEVDTSRPHVLEGTGAEIWSSLASEGWHGVDEIAAGLAERYGSGIDRLRPDVEAFLWELAEAGLVVHDDVSERSASIEMRMDEGSG